MSILCGILSPNPLIECYQISRETACTTRASGLVTQFLTCFVFEPGSTSSLTSEGTFWLAEEIFHDETAALRASIHAVPIA
jgi:hypothetical protein